MRMTEIHKTGEKVPVSGVYSYQGTVGEGTNCVPTREERHVPLSKGETFPPVKSCSTGAKWKLDRRA